MVRRKGRKRNDDWPMDRKLLIRELFKQRQGYSHWHNILKFFIEHRTELTDPQKKRILNRIEKYRTDHNRDEKNSTDKIRREDTYPNIYSELKHLEAKKRT